MNNKKGSLHYYLPKPSKKHTIISIPESHTLYVGPLSCTRRHAINATKYANRKDVSFLFITEGDVISGSYEDLIIESIGKLIDCLSTDPKVLMIAVFCIDDFLGTDEEALVKRLHETYPEKKFAVQHIDPVSMDERVDMGSKKMSTLYSFLETPKEKDRGINFLGNFVSIPSDSEFLKLLKDWGFGPVREIFNMKTFDEYQGIAKSALSVTMRFMSERNAEGLFEKFEIPHYTFYSNYDPERIARAYFDIAEILNVEEEHKDDPSFFEKSKSEIEQMKEEALKDIEETRKLLDGMPLAIDSSASIPTFQTAKTLLDYGFNLKYLFRSSHKFKIDVEAENYILNNRPDVKVSRASDYENLISDEKETNVMALGLDCARLLKAEHVVDIWHDEGYFGFQGIKKLMGQIRDAYKIKTDWENTPELKFKKGGR